MIRSIGAFALLGLATFGSETRAYELKETEAGTPVRWPVGQRQINVVVDRAIDPYRRPMVIEALRGATEAWSSGGQTRLVLDANGDPEQSPVVLVTWPKEQWPYNEGELAITAVRAEATSGDIISATIRINDQYEWSTLEGARNTDYAHDLQSILTHELGHALGLAHSDELEATMHAGAAPRETKKRTLEEDDRAALIALYGSEPMVENLVAEPEMPFGCTTAASAGDAIMPLFVLFGLALLRARR